MARAAVKLGIESTPFGRLAAGSDVTCFTLTSSSGLSAKFLDYGATLISCCAPDRTGKSEEVTLHYKTLEEVVAGDAYFGATCGRVANRIAGGTFDLGGETYKLAVNNGPNSLHGGTKGFDKVVWDAKPYEEADKVGIKFSFLSEDGDEGYPGNLNCVADYSITAADELRMSFSATTDKATPINMCNHAYWNLSGAVSSDIKSHVLKLNASRYLPVDGVQIPTGELAAVADTCMDLTLERPLGTRLLDSDGGGEPGYDHCYVVDRKEDDDELSLVGRLSDPESGRVMTITSTQPGVQVYTGNFLPKGEPPFAQHHAVALETQHFPDSIHFSDFPNTVLNPGETYNELTVHTFSTE